MVSDDEMIEMCHNLPLSLWMDVSYFFLFNFFNGSLHSCYSVRYCMYVSKLILVVHKVHDFNYCIVRKKEDGCESRTYVWTNNAQWLHNVCAQNESPSFYVRMYVCT